MGESIRPLEYSIDGHVLDIFELIRQLELEKVNVLGYSRGSYVDLRIGENNCDTINHLILACTKAKNTIPSVARLLKKPILI